MVQARAPVVCGCFLASRPHGRCCRRRARCRACRRGNQERSGDLLLCITKIPEVDQCLGITADGSYVVVIREVVQCALLNLKAQANKTLEGKGSQNLAQMLGNCALATDWWPGATHAQATCEVRHIDQVLTWALSRHGGTRWLSDDASVALVTTVQKTACDLALSVLTRTKGSTGADMAGVDAEVRHLRADLESAKEDLHRTHTEIAVVQSEVNCFSLVFMNVKQDLDREGFVSVRTISRQHHHNLEEEASRFWCLRRTHTTLWSSPLATLHCEATS
jgi:hypothetical protein